jgi:hypothetical protein
VAATRSIEWLVRSRRAPARGGANFIIARDGRIAATYVFLDKRWSSDVRFQEQAHTADEYFCMWLTSVVGRLLGIWIRAF